MFVWSPELCRYLEAHKDWYTDDLMLLKKAGEEKREQGGARPQILPAPRPTAP